MAFLTRVESSYAKARPHYKAQVVAAVASLFDRFMDERLADPTFSTQIAKGSATAHQQRMAELLLADFLWSADFSLASGRRGPDFHASRGKFSAWIELITPEPSGIDPDWLAGGQGVRSYPHHEIALRYTSALKEKRDKLVGSATRPGYIAQGIVAKTECYVIAVNQSLLQPSFRTLDGISGIPTACEVAFGVGPRQLTIDKATTAVVARGHSHRPHLVKPAGNTVPADTFLDPAYACVSGILALALVLEKFVTPDLDTHLLQDHLSALVYNPLAVSSLPRKWLPAQTYWEAKIDDEAVVVRSV